MTAAAEQVDAVPVVDLAELSERAKERAAEMDAALARGAWVSKPRAPSPLQPIGSALGGPDAIEQGARDWARKWKLIDERGQLHCANAGCRKVIPWHVSLHCVVCRVDEQRERPKRMRREREERERRAEQQRLEEQSRPARVGGRSFRDGY